MALSFGFYNSVEHDRVYDAVQFGQIFDGIITDGVYGTYLKAMMVIASENPNEVVIQPGRAWFNHTWSYNDANYPFAAPEPEVLLDRIDTLVLDINSEQAERTNSFLWLKGTPSSQNPQPPTFIRSITHNQYPICNVYRKAGTTMIYTADITNRVGTSDTPFVTGVLQGIDLDAWISQWDDEFHRWENSTKEEFSTWEGNQKTSFETWEGNQKTSFETWEAQRVAAYNVWFQTIETQQRQDKASWDAWYASTIESLHNLPEQSAEYLQIEIDDIIASGMSGSIINVTTTNASLEGKTVTISNSDNTEVKTSTFDSSLKVQFTGLKSVGDITISSTDGIQIAEKVVNIPYFSNYIFNIAFWAAPITINGDAELAGLTVTIKDSHDVTVETVVLDGNASGSFVAPKPDEYTFQTMYDGELISDTIDVQYEMSYTVNLSIFRATVNITGNPASFLKNKVVTVTNDLDSSVETITLDENATGTYVAKKPATYTFSVDY